MKNINVPPPPIKFNNLFLTMQTDRQSSGSSEMWWLIGSALDFRGRGPGFESDISHKKKILNKTMQTIVLRRLSWRAPTDVLHSASFSCTRTRAPFFDESDSGILKDHILKGQSNAISDIQFVSSFKPSCMGH